MKILDKIELPLVTVGIPVYNDERYLATAISDILAQTYRNLEIVISDNFSNDRTEAICRSFLCKDARLRYVRQEQNIGPHANFKYLVDHANGEYFMWAASDDRWHEEFIERLVESLERDSGSAVAFCTYSEIDEQGVLLPGRYRFNFSGSTAVSRITKFHFERSGRRDAFFYGLFRKSLADKMEFHKWWWINDTIALNLAYPPLSYILVAGNYSFVNSEEPLWLNRIHLNSTPRHSAEQSSRSVLFRFFAFVLRKLNQLYETEKSIINSSGSLLTGILVFPVLITRFLYDCALELRLVVLAVVRKPKN